MPVIYLHTNTGEKVKIDTANEINRGGEGSIIYLPDAPEYVAKVYHSNIAPPIKEQLDFIRKLDSKYFIVPNEILFENKNIRGIIMEYLDDAYKPIANLLNKTYCQRNGINHSFKFDIALHLINAVDYAHKNKIVIGDLNQYNIMFDKHANLKFIDTDSYQTPFNRHSGRLLDDIRDYLYNGTIHTGSDYYALAVLLFYLFTNTHPFKGIHKKYKSLQERIQRKLPVFTNDNQLIVPKCFEPIKDDKLQEQFRKIFTWGDRFLISLGKQPVLKKIKAQKFKITSESIHIQQLFQNTQIRDVQFNTKHGYIETDNDFILFNAVQKGIMNKKMMFSKDQVDELFFSDKIFYRKADSLFLVEGNGKQAKEITNIDLSSVKFIQQYENILMLVEPNCYTIVYLDEIVNSTIKNKKINAFGRGFFRNNGLFQFAGSKNRIFYNTGNNLATVKIPKKVLDIYQRGKYGVIKYSENEKIICEMFRIDGLQPELIGIHEEELVHFDILSSNNIDYLLKPGDNNISIIKDDGSQIISSIEVPCVSNQSSLFHTIAGIIIWEGNEVFLLNRK